MMTVRINLDDVFYVQRNFCHHHPPFGQYILAYPVRLATFNLKISHDPDIDEYLSSDALIRIILILYADFRGCKFAGLD